MDVNDGHISGPPGHGPHSVAGTGGGADAGPPVHLGLAEEPPIHPRLLAMIVAGRYHGLELDPNEYRGTPGDASPSAASLSAWAQGTGMWSRAVRLRWRHLMRFHNTGPVVLLFADGTAGLLTGINTEHKVVFVKDPTAPAADAPVPVDELRLSEVWAGEAVLLRASRGFSETDAPFSLRWLLGLVMQEKRSLREIGLASFALSMLTIFPPFLVMTVVDKVLTHNSYSTLALIAVIVGIAILYETLLGYARRLIVLVVGARIDARINLHVFNRLLRLPLDYFERHPAGETMYKISQIHRVREFITGRLLSAFLDLMTLCVLLPFLFWLNSSLAWIVLGCACVIAIVILAFLRPLSVLYGRVVAAETAKQSVLGETVFGVRTVKSLALEPQRKALWDEKIAEAGKWRMAYGRLANWPQTLVTPVERFMWMGAILLGVYWALSDSSGTGAGALFAFMMLSQRVAQPLVQLARLTDEYQDVAAAIGQAASVLNRPLEVDAASGGMRPRFAGAISFDDVTFTYGGTKTPALDRITFSIPAGTMLGIVGRSGSGKSTITRLLQGINRDYSGYLKIDGSDLREINLRHLRQSFGVVLQDNFLFRGSIRDNILAGRPGLTLEDAVRAARLAGAEEFIERMPNGYETYIEEGSPNLSGGQKQRLAIARALINDPRILILDEATSALDPESEALVNANLLRAARGIVWIIASMFAAILLAMGLIEVDRVVTAQGRVVSRSPTMVLQPLEASIVRSIEVHEGQAVQAGQVLAQLDPTFAAADVGALAAQVSTLQAQVSRLQAEADGQPFTYTGLDPNLALQAAIFGQRQAEYTFKLENYTQKINGLVSAIAKANSDATGYRSRLEVATNVEKMRRDLERMQVGSKLNTLAAMDNRAEMERNLRAAIETAASAQRDLAALAAERDGYVQSWHADISEKLADATGKLSDARESLNKAQLRKQLVELRADRDSTVLTVAKVSVGSVLQSGQQFITLVPADAPLEVEANISGRDDGFINVGDPVSVKFDTFPFIQYGLAYGTVRTVSADSFTAQDEQRNPTGMVPVSANSSEPYYRARIAIDRVELHGTPPDFHLMPGMPVTADIKVGKRTVMQYLLGRALPIASEGMREP